MRLEKVEWYEVPKHWEAIKDWVAKALSEDAVMYRVPDIFLRLVSKDMHLWLAWDGNELKACCIVRLSHYRFLFCCSIIVIAGSGIEDWLCFSQDVEQWARLQGCEAVEGHGRIGWKKPAKHFGYEVASVIYRKRI